MSVSAIGAAAPQLASLQQSQPPAVSVDADGDRDGDTSAADTAAAAPSTTVNALGQTLGAKVNTTA